MPILPLAQFEADLEEDRKAYQQLKPPTSIVVRFGVMKLVGEFPYGGDAKPGCGSKIIVRTHRGVELGEMLTSTCPNAGCSKSVSRKEMLEYIENSGGRDYPFFNQGKVLRIATAEDLSQQAALDATRPRLVMEARAHAGDLKLPLKVVDAEPILGGERLTYYFTSEERVDFRELVGRLAGEQRTRIEMRQVGARDEARLTADYERCGQHCCCKQFLKVLKPISMRSAKIQKATLDPLKISGRCGRLMCCLRYEDQTYDELRKRLPRKKSRVLTPEGWGIVLDSQILTQLVLVKLEQTEAEVVIPVEDLGTGPGTPEQADPDDADDLDVAGTDAPPAGAAVNGAAPRAAPPQGRPQQGGPRPGGRGPGMPGQGPQRRDGEGRDRGRQERPQGAETRRDGGHPQQQRPPHPPPRGPSDQPPSTGARQGPPTGDGDGPEAHDETSQPGGGGPPGQGEGRRRRRRRRRRGGGPGNQPESGGSPPSGGAPQGGGPGGGGGGL